MTQAQPARLLRFPRRRARRRRTASPVGAATVLRFPAPRPSSFLVVLGDSLGTRRPRSAGLSMTLSIKTAALRRALLARMDPMSPPPRTTTSRRRR